jgi:hypothetical protein
MMSTLSVRSGAVNVMTGIYTGRSPKDKFIVDDATSHDTVWWDSEEYHNDNHKATPEAWNAVKEIAKKELSNKKLFVVDGFCGTHKDTRMKVRFIVEVGVHIEYLATPDLTDKVLIIADPMLATGISMEMGMKAFLTKGNPKHIHIACVLAAPEGIEHIKKTFPEDKTTIWCASIDEGLNEHKYIVPGFGDAGDLCYGSKL